MDGEDQVGSPDAGSFDMSEFLTGTSPEGETTPGTGIGGATEQGVAGAEGQQQGFRFGGRDYKSQQEAEKAHGQLYGRFSETQGLMNKLKGALSGADPELLQALMEDPNARDALSKMGISETQRRMAEEQRNAPDAGFDWNSVPQPMQELYEGMQIDREHNKLDREMWTMERQLGRSFTPEENDAMMTLIERAPNLTVAEAYKLAHHDKLLEQAAKGGQARGAKQAANTPRPRPTVPGIPGVPMDLKKAVGNMSPEEWREHLKNSPEFQKLMER
jgi:hypothetical protein